MLKTTSTANWQNKTRDTVTMYYL